jgi:hypothetical protein
MKGKNILGVVAPERRCATMFLFSTGYRRAKDLSWRLDPVAATSLTVIQVSRTSVLCFEDQTLRPLLE